MVRNIGSLTSNTVLCVIVVVVHIHARSGPVVSGVKRVHFRNIATRKIRPVSHLLCRIQKQSKRLSASLSSTLVITTDTGASYRAGLTDTMQPPMQISPCTSCWILLSLTNACLWYVTHLFNGCPAIWWPFDPDEPLTFPFGLDGACRSAKSHNTDIFVANIRLFWIILNIAKRYVGKSE